MPSDESKLFKNESADEGEGEKKPTLVGSKKLVSATCKSKATNANADNSHPKGLKVKKEELQYGDSPKPTRPSATANKVKKEEEDDDDDLPISRKISSVKIDKDVKKKTKKEEVHRKGKAGAEQKQREKKNYELPGQKRDPPEERDPLRIFYETLYMQLPKSEMAQIWMMECGLLSEDDAQRVYEKRQKQKQSFRSPSKSAAAVKSSSKSVTVQKTTSPSSPPIKKKTNESAVTLKESKKRKVQDKINEDHSDDDFVLSAKAKKRKV